MIQHDLDINEPQNSICTALLLDQQYFSNFAKSISSADLKFLNLQADLLYKKILICMKEIYDLRLTTCLIDPKSLPTSCISFLRSCDCFAFLIYGFVFNKNFTTE